MTGLDKIQIKEFDSVIDLLEELDREGITGQERAAVYKRYMNLRARMHGHPYSGGFELTPLCNFDCKMCYVHLNRTQMGDAKLLSTEQWIRIMEQAINAGMMHAYLTGGECLSYPGFRELYLYLRSRGLGVSVLTNGQLLTEEMADFFAQYPPDMIQITVYGSCDDAYEAVTGHRAFEDVKQAIERLKKRNLRLFLAVTPNRFMQDDGHALLEYLRSTGVRYGVGTGSLPAREDTGRKLEEYSPESDVYVQLHQDEREYYKSITRWDNGKMNLVDYIPTGFDAKSKIPCSSGVCAFHINWKGEMTPCIPFNAINRSVLMDGFDDCWLWIKEQMTAYEPPKECLECPNSSVCVSCPAERTLGVLNGPVSKAVCERYAHFVRAGILKIPEEQECM